MSDDFIDGEGARLEERFRELEYEAEIERLRRQGGGAPRDERETPPANDAPETDEDPLAKMKAALDDDAELERFVLTLCPHCEAKNRMSLERLRTGEPRCGRCKQDLSFTKV